MTGIPFKILERVINRPLLIHPAKLGVIVSVLAGRGGGFPLEWADADLSAEHLPDGARAVLEGPLASRFVGSASDRDAPGGQLPYQRTASGVAVIPIIGTLVNRGAWIGAKSGLTSYEGLKVQLAAATADPKVKGILLDIDSPGGEAIGAEQAAAAVQDAARQNPVTSVVNGMAASAAYWIASAARRIVIAESSVAGSIGVVLMHADYSRMLDREGVTPTLIFAGAHKVDGNPYQALPESVRADLQAEVETFYRLFVDGVARGRRMSADAVKKTEARTFIGGAAVYAGLADAIGSFETALAELSRGASPTRSTFPPSASAAAARPPQLASQTAATTALPSAPAPAGAGGHFNQRTNELSNANAPAGRVPNQAGAAAWEDVYAAESKRRGLKPGANFGRHADASHDDEPPPSATPGGRVPNQAGAVAWETIYAEENARRGMKPGPNYPRRRGDAA